jgi:hypothetical protein
MGDQVTGVELRISGMAVETETAHHLAVAGYS